MFNGFFKSYLYDELMTEDWRILGIGFSLKGHFDGRQGFELRTRR